MTGGTQPQFNANKISNLKIPLPDIETQRRIVTELDKQMQILEGLHMMKTDAQKKINQILADVWGVEYVEPVKMEVEDEQEN